MPKMSPEKGGTAVPSPQLPAPPSSNWLKDTHQIQTYGIIPEGKRRMGLSCVNEAKKEYIRNADCICFLT